MNKFVIIALFACGASAVSGTLASRDKALQQALSDIEEKPISLQFDDYKKLFKDFCREVEENDYFWDNEEGRKDKTKQVAFEIDAAAQKYGLGNGGKTKDILSRLASTSAGADELTKIITDLKNSRIGYDLRHYSHQFCDKVKSHYWMRVTVTVYENVTDWLNHEKQ